MRRKLLTAAGFSLLVLGGIGIFLPVWPTTPFVLGAAGCFASNPKLSKWLKQNRLFREYIEHYENGGQITKGTVIKSLTFLWFMLGLSAFLLPKPIVLTILLLVGVCVTIHILSIARKQ